MYTRRMPEQFLFTKEKGSLFNVKGWMKLLVKKSTPCYGNKNRNMQQVTKIFYRKALRWRFAEIFIWIN